MTEGTQTASRLPISEALALLHAGSAVLVDTRDQRLYDNLHAAGALSLPLAQIDAPDGKAVAALPGDRLILLYCA
ncbi:MAG TPA: rhodanese-like domain-containing protein [Gemmatimonadales bacterium]|jgi:rhodanese-related sulfurtransferase|nr:rhodanese-like domain-containing protein [Gemmatimonadales bacterium]